MATIPVAFPCTIMFSRAELGAQPTVSSFLLNGHSEPCQDLSSHHIPCLATDSTQQVLENKYYNDSSEMTAEARLMRLSYCGSICH